jgi:murein L,D-transpeptidase YafK
MKIHLGRLIGDIFYYCFCVISIFSFILIMATPARGFVWDELKKLTDIRGEQSGPVRFRRKLDEIGLSLEEIKPEILIRKRNRELVVLSENLVLATYPVGLGRNPMGIKLNGADEKTPEGQYYVCGKDDQYKYHLFLQINYPAPDDAKRGSVQQLLKPGQEKKILEAWNKHEPPPTDTSLGGPLGIHGFGAESNWTRDGSIAMHNFHLEEIFWILATGTPVAIVP